MKPMDIKNQIDRIKRSFKLDISQVLAFPPEILNTYGIPIGIEKVEEGFLVSLTPWPSIQFKIILISESGEVKKTLYETSLFIMDFLYNPQTQELLTIEINGTDLFKGNLNAALEDKRNAITRVDTKSGNRSILLSGEKEPFLPTSACFDHEKNILFHDYVSQKIRAITDKGTPITDFPVGPRFIRRVKVSDSGDIYFISMSDKSWFKGTETAETLYKMDRQGNLEPIHRNDYGKAPFDQLLDFEIHDDSIFMVSDYEFRKLDKQGQTVYKTAFQHAAWSPKMDLLAPYILVLKKEEGKPGVFYAICTSYYVKDYRLLKICV